MNKLNDLRQTICLIKLQSESKIEILESEIKKNKFGAYRLEKFLNDFSKKITDRPQAFIKFGELDELEIDFKTITFPGKRTFWKGYLKPSVPNQLGVKLEMTISEIWHDSTNCFCYGVTVEMSLKEENKNSEYAMKVFGIGNKPSKNKKGKSLL